MASPENEEMDASAPTTDSTVFADEAFEWQVEVEDLQVTPDITTELSNEDIGKCCND